MVEAARVLEQDTPIYSAKNAYQPCVGAVLSFLSLVSSIVMGRKVKRMSIFSYGCIGT